MRLSVKWTRGSRVIPIALAVGCAEQQPSLAPNPPSTGVPAGVIVSAARGLVDPAPAAFVSIAPHWSEGANEVIVRNTAAGLSVRAAMTDGGLDPIQLPAGPGDVLSVEVVGAGTRPHLLAAVRLPPVIVRTYPAKRRASVPLNSLLVVVFSEPIDPASVTSRAVRLLTGGAPQGTALTLRNDGTTLEIRPDAPLIPSTDYDLEIDPAIRDLEGDHLAVGDVIPFSTAAMASGDPPGAVRILPDTLLVPVNAQSGFVVLVDNGAHLINSFPDPSVTWQSRDPAVARIPLHSSGVAALAIGQTWVVAEYQGQIDSALVIVTTSPPPGPFSVFPDAAVAPVGHEMTFGVRTPVSGGGQVVSWATSDPTMLTITPAGVATMVRPGVAYVIASDGVTTDSAEIEIYPVSLPLGSLYEIYPGTILLQVGDAWTLQLIGPEAPPPVVWRSTDPAVAAVDGRGVVTATQAGTALAIAQFTDGSADTAIVQVVPAGSLGHISLQPPAVSASVGDTVRLTLEYDSTATATVLGQPVGWTVRSTGPVLRILSGGTFEAVQPGTAEIRAYVGPLFTQVVTLTVTP